MPKKFKKDLCGGNVALRTLTQDSDSGLQLRTPISEKCQKKIRKDPCGGCVALALRTLTEESDSGLQLRTPISEKCQKI